MLPKAGDSLTYTTTNSPSTASALTTKYAYSAGTYQGQAALLLTLTTTVNGISTTATAYLDPATGGVLQPAANAATTVTTTYTPADYEARIYNAVYNVGQVANVAVKTRITGKGITDAFSAIGGATALTMDYSFSVERKPNETLVVPAGSFANSCKLQINVTISNVKVEGNDGTNPLFASMWETVASVFTQPFKNTVWLTNKMVNVPKVYLDASSSLAGTVTATQELTAYTLAPR